MSQASEKVDNPEHNNNKYKNIKDDDDDLCLLQRPVCDANASLSGRYGSLGRVMGALSSNLVVGAFVGLNPRLHYLTLEAGKWGRLGGSLSSCRLAYPCQRNGTWTGHDGFAWVEG